MPEIIVFEGWEQFAVLAALISVFASTLLLLLSRALDLRNLEQAVKVELVYAASTVFIVLLLIIAINGGEDLLRNIASQMFLSSYGLGPGVLTTDANVPLNLIDITKLYMEPALACSESIIQTLYILDIPVEAIASVYVEIFMSEQAGGFGFKIISERILNAVQFLQFYVFSYYVLTHALDFIKYYALFFVSVGVVLRAFPPTRGAGGYVIALAIGFYLIFPISYIIGSSITLPYIKTNMNINENPEYASSQGATTHVACTVRSNIPTDVKYYGFNRISKVFESKSWLDSINSQINALFDDQLSSLFTHITYTICFLPLVALVLTMTFVLQTSGLFGANIPEIGRGLIRFI